MRARLARSSRRCVFRSRRRERRFRVKWQRRILNAVDALVAAGPFRLEGQCVVRQPYPGIVQVVEDDCARQPVVDLLLEERK